MREIEPLSKSKTTSIPESFESDLDLQPQTPLGLKLMELRAKHIKSGVKLLTADEVLEEKARRRGSRQIEEDQ